MKSARLTAFEILDGVFRNSSYSNLALDSALKEADSKDRAFISQLVYGVIERKITLDYLLSLHLKSRTKPKVKTVLYIGAYQLYFSKQIPSHAVINETVKLCDDIGMSFYKGLVNAVLRKLDSERVDIGSLSDSVRYSCPQELIDMWTKQYSKETAQTILENLNTVAPVFAIPNPLYVTPEELTYELSQENVKSEVKGDIVRILSPLNITESSAFSKGLFHIEDLSSYICASELEANENDTVIDICSAPGGKAFTIAEKMNNKGSLYAFDLQEHRVYLINKGAERLGLTNIHTAVNDACVYNESMPKADKILCDVPCSGFGVIRRKPEIRYKELDSINELPEIQYNILKTSSEYLKYNGRIIYSTCTLNKKENEKVVERFLNENNSFSLIKMKTILPSKDGGDGFFYAVLEKKND